MRNIIYIILISALLSSCKKSREARQLERCLEDTTWEFYYALDADGSDITAQVLADSLICTQFTFKKNDRDASTFNTIVEDCHNTYYVDYRGNWVIFDWDKLKRTPKWKDIGVAIGNVGLETQSSLLYLGEISFSVDLESDLLENRIYKLKVSGLPTDTLLETRFYRKVE
jgi:hypothetical protein